MKIASYLIILDEGSHIKDVIEHHLPFLDALYILDTGSTDGTLEYLQSVVQTNSKVILEQYHQSFIPEYEVDWDQMKNPFPEVEIRNHAIKRAELLTEADWMLQIDGDDIWLPRVRELIEEQPGDVAFLGCSTHNPTVALSSLPIEIRQGKKLYDPHVRVWRTKYGVHYIKNPAFINHKNSQMHCIPTVEKLYGRHLYHHSQIRFTEEPIQFHLHWLYGRKMELYFNNKGIFDRREMIEGQVENECSHLIPDLFWQRREQWLNGEEVGVSR